MWGATSSRKKLLTIREISIHAPRVGSDLLPDSVMIYSSYFNPRSPCGERRGCHRGTRVPEISIHAPRVGSDASRERPQRLHLYFNPRSPCGERLINNQGISTERQFQSTLPVWGATLGALQLAHRRLYFNPRSPCGERQQRCTDFSFASSAKKVLFVIFSKLGGCPQGIC